MDRECYFGRFLGRRLVFVHHDDVDDFIRITRDQTYQLKELELEVLEIIKEFSGITNTEIQKVTKLKKSEIQQIINSLENQLYISRIGWELTLKHGGFAKPQYIALPRSNYSEDKHKNSLRDIIMKSFKWYGPLSLQDLLRITRAPYNLVESALATLDSSLSKKSLLTKTYFGLPDDFIDIEEGEIEVINEVSILSQLDPYFYMTSGFMYRSSLPRQSRLSIVMNGQVVGNIEYRIPDRDILQILNIQIPRKYETNSQLLHNIGHKLISIGQRVFHTNAVFIEEINHKAANHTENKLFTHIFTEINYHLKIDHLIGGTKPIENIDTNAIFETRLLNPGL